MNTLNDLFDLYGSDKGSAKHNYGPVYESYLEPFRQYSVNLLEIGVLRGSSMRAWRDYFPDAKLWGLDIDPRSTAHMQNEHGINLMIGSQDDNSVLDRLASDAGDGFDIIIDDGSHMVDHIIASLTFLFPLMHPGGIYIVEDLLESYHADAAEFRKWSGMHLNPKLPNNRRCLLDRLFNGWIRTMDHGRGDLESIHFHRELVVLRKNRTRL